MLKKTIKAILFIWARISDASVISWLFPNWGTTVLSWFLACITAFLGKIHGLPIYLWLPLGLLVLILTALLYRLLPRKKVELTKDHSPVEQHQKLPQAGSIGSVSIGGSGNAFSYNQAGGVTAGTFINQAIPPKVTIEDTSVFLEDSVFTATFRIHIEAKSAPLRIKHKFRAEGLLSAQIRTVSVNGVCTILFNSVITNDIFEFEIPCPLPDYIAIFRLSKIGSMNHEWDCN